MIETPDGLAKLLDETLTEVCECLRNGVPISEGSNLHGELAACRDGIQRHIKKSQQLKMGHSFG
jgi:hypothetical protein